MIGVPDRSYVVLLAGELFGEEGLSEKVEDRVAKASVFAVGTVTVAFVSLEVLKAMEILDVVRGGALDEEFERDVLDGASVKTSEENLERLEKARKLTVQFLNSNKLKDLEEKVQRRSLKKKAKKDSHSEPRRDSLTFRMKAKRLYVVKNLHQTAVVHVTLAMHDPSCQVLVVKELDVAEANKEGMGQYVLAEQAVLAQVSSGFVANMISSWEEPDRLFLALEPALAGDLYDLLKLTMQTPEGSDMCPKRGEMGGFNLDFLRFSSACCVLALKHLFEHQVIHRDIKPNNMVLDQFGYCKLVDFGIAKRLPSGTCRTYSLLGSPKYMSPELVNLAFHGRGQPYTNAVDWWAFGMSLIELATGKLPYWDPSKSKATSDRARNEEALAQVDRYHRDVMAASRAAIKLGSSYSPYESHIWFEPFRDSKDKAWNDFGKFVAKLLNPEADSRLGSATTNRGPREAMDQEFFANIKFDRIARKKAVAPFLPNKLMVDLDDAVKKAKASQLTRLDKMREQKRGMLQNSSRGGERPKHPGMLARSKPKEVKENVESRVRASLEVPDINNVKMNEAFQSTDQARKQMIMARDQHIRRVAYKQGYTLDTIDSKMDWKQQSNLMVLQRASVIETMSVLERIRIFNESGGGEKARLDLSALRIQTTWRGYHARLQMEKVLKAARVIQRFYSILKRKRNARKADAANSNDAATANGN